MDISVCHGKKNEYFGHLKNINLNREFNPRGDHPKDEHYDKTAKVIIIGF